MCRVRCSAAADVTSSAACLMNWPASFEGSCGRRVCFCIHFHGLLGYSNVRSHTEQISLNAGRETFKTILMDAWRQVWGKVGVPLQLCGQAQFAGVDVAVQRAARCPPMRSSWAAEWPALLLAMDSRAPSCPRHDLTGLLAHRPDSGPQREGFSFRCVFRVNISLQ